MLLLLIASWPFANFVTNNYHRDFSFIQLTLFWGGLCGVLACGLFLIIFVAKRFSVSSKPWIMVFYVCVFLFFSYTDFELLYGQILDSRISQLEALHIKFSYVWTVGVLVLLSLTFYLSRKKSGYDFLRVLLWVIPSFSLLQATWLMVTQPRGSADTTANFPLQHLRFKTKPNVYFILLDAYGRVDVLKRELGFDNTPFLKDLQKRGFQIHDQALSNYHFTLASLNATFAMSYHQPDVQGIVNKNREFYSAWKGPNAVYELFKKNGYKTVFVTPGCWGDIGGSGYEDYLVEPGVSNNDTLLNLLSYTPLKKFTSRLATGYTTFQNMEDLLTIDPQAPKFFYIHSALVHDSMYTENGGIKEHRTCVGIDTPQSAKEYLHSIRGINREVSQFIDQTQQEDPHAIIILCADHGPPFLEYSNKNPNDPIWLIPPISPQDFEKQFGNLSAIYVPNCSQRPEACASCFPPDITLVNIFRGLFAYLSETPPDFLENASYFVQYDTHKKVYYLVSPDNLKQKFAKD